MSPNRLNHNTGDKTDLEGETYMGPRRQHYLYAKCQLCINLFKWLPVIFITSVLAWGYYAYVIQLCLFNMDSVILQIVCLTFFHFLYIMTFWSYFQTIFTKPGIIPKKFWLTTRDSERLTSNDDRRGQIIQQISYERGLPISCLDATGSPRICDKCNIIKPDRAHHCAACNTCVLKMDHHCPWVNNCVSFTNYKFFVLFLAYAFFLCLFTAASSLHYFLLFWRNQLTNDGRFHILFLFFVSIMFAISLVSLFGYHLYLVTLNRSTLESFRPPMFSLGPDKNAYNLGRYQNWIQIFGKSKLKWFIPIYTSLGDGVIYPSKASLEDFESSSGHNQSTQYFVQQQKSQQQQLDGSSERTLDQHQPLHQSNQHQQPQQQTAPFNAKLTTHSAYDLYDDQEPSKDGPESPPLDFEISIDKNKDHQEPQEFKGSDPCPA